MKIEGQNPAQTSEVSSANPVAPRSRTESSAARVADQDRVELSADAELFANAKRAIDDAPAVRTDLVDRMKGALASGELGADPYKIADGIIDHLLDK